jgi:hypothetical protein
MPLLRRRARTCPTHPPSMPGCATSASADLSRKFVRLIDQYNKVIPDILHLLEHALKDYKFADSGGPYAAITALSVWILLSFGDADGGSQPYSFISTTAQQSQRSSTGSKAVSASPLPTVTLPWTSTPSTSSQSCSHPVRAYSVPNSISQCPSSSGVHGACPT